MPRLSQSIQHISCLVSVGKQEMGYRGVLCSGLKQMYCEG